MLKQQKFLIIDCQTTGMHPSIGQLLEIAWCYVSADELLSGVAPVVHSGLIDTGTSLPWRVQEITGLKASDFASARSVEDVRAEFLSFLESCSSDGAPLWSVIHYAQFERVFLEQFLFGSAGAGELPFSILCTHMIAKRLFPQAPSRNIRALSGFLGAHIGEVKRAADHVRATLEIWKGLSAEISSLPVLSADELLEWSKSSSTKRAKVSNASYEYRVDRAKRLALPARPGVYRMLSKTGLILYVGKATCLKDRVNSYFRGKRGRDPRKLEMMAQTWDLQVTECASALEAAVLESDEIKRHDPPYNVSLKGTRRRLLFYDRAFDSSVSAQDEAHGLGPFRAMNSIEDLKQLIDWRRFGPGVIGGGGHLFYGLYEDDIVQSGYEIFVSRHPEYLDCGESVRAHLAYAVSMYRAWVRSDDETVAQSEEDLAEAPLEESETAAEEIDEDITPDEMADKFERMYLRAAQTLKRTRMINKLMNSRVSWRENEKDFELTVCGGHIVRASGFASMSDASFEEPAVAKRVAWSSLGVADYDRMSVLASELTAREGRVQLIPSAHESNAQF